MDASNRTVSDLNFMELIVMTIDKVLLRKILYEV